jgi:probable F420-dependent oxidoreductase
VPASPSRAGVLIPLDGIPMSEHGPVLRQLCELGYGEVWTGEGGAFDAVVPLAAAAAWAPQLHIAAGVLPVYTRGPAVLAMTAATLAELAPGRVTFGIGAGSPAVVEAWNAATYTDPVGRVRDTLRFLRAALAGERVDERYDTFEIRGFRLQHPPAVPPALLVGALRPRMLALAAEEADGATVTWCPLDQAARVADAFHSHGGGRLVASLAVCPSTDVDEVRRRARPIMAAYLTVPAYAAFQRWLGRGPQLEAMWEAWDRGDRAGALAAIPDAAVDDFIISGTPEHCRRRLDEYLGAGFTDTVVNLYPRIGDGLEALRRLAPRAVEPRTA